MISFDLECTDKHRFEGIFKDYQAFNDQLDKKMIECPVCGDTQIKRLFTGCSIQSGGVKSETADIEKSQNIEAQENIRALQQNNPSQADNKNQKNISEIISALREFVTNNFDNVGKDFAEKARAIYYGVEKERNIYGESTLEEIKELIEEGVNVMPLPVDDKLEN